MYDHKSHTEVIYPKSPSAWKIFSLQPFTQLIVHSTFAFVAKAVTYMLTYLRYKVKKTFPGKSLCYSSSLSHGERLHLVSNWT